MDAKTLKEQEKRNNLRKQGKNLNLTLDLKKKEDSFKNDNIYRIKNATIRDLHKEFPKHAQDYIYQALVSHSNSVDNAREYLKNPKNTSIFIF